MIHQGSCHCGRVAFQVEGEIESALACLEAVRVPDRLPPSVRLARARALRGELGQSQFKPRDIDAIKRQGRP